MSTVDVLDAQGSKTGTAELPAELFDVTANIPLIHQVVVAQLAAARQGTHASKGRGEVRGGGAKPYRQKGTGRARQGSRRSPQFVGGGVVHGPQPHGYAQRTPKKMIAAALRGALSDRAREGRVHVVSDLVPGDLPSTKTALGAVRAASSTDKVLVVLHRSEDLAWLSLRNVVTVHAIAVDQLNAYDVLVNDEVLFTEAALAEYVNRSGNATAWEQPPAEEPIGEAVATDDELASATVEDSAEPSDAELAATAASVAEVLEPSEAPEPEEEDQAVSEPASSPSNTAAPRTRPTSVSEEDS
ncbi:MAG TPA: 50S ribosomal protein L4 [Propionibacteriaceae bacterium]|nr:50S ribosomal protein L4 [Propionibacteriaceae bacterium]